jgi:hypothetical protein
VHRKMPKLSHTPYTYKQIVELASASLATNIVSRTNCIFVKPQNGPTPHEHASQGFHVAPSEAQPSLVHLPTSIGRNYLPI